MLRICENNIRLCERVCDRDSDHKLESILTKFGIQARGHSISVIFVNGQNHFNGSKMVDILNTT